MLRNSFIDLQGDDDEFELVHDHVVNGYSDQVEVMDWVEEVLDWLR